MDHWIGYQLPASQKSKSEWHQQPAYGVSFLVDRVQAFLPNQYHTIKS